MTLGRLLSDAENAKSQAEASLAAQIDELKKAKDKLQQSLSEKNTDYETLAQEMAKVKISLSKITELERQLDTIKREKDALERDK